MKKHLPQAIAGLLIAVGIPFQLSGQTPPAIEWQHSYGGSMSDAAHSISPTSDGGYILAGYTDSNDGDVTGHHGLRDIWVVKLRSDGTLEWQRCFGGTWQEQNIAVIFETLDGGYILGGTTSSFDGDVDCPDPPASRIWVAKIDPAGQLSWQRCLGGGGFDTFASIAFGPDGYVVCGHTSSNDGDAISNNGSVDLLLVKLDLGGNTVWSRCYGGSRADVGRHVISTLDGNYLIAAQTQSNDGDIAGLNTYYVLPSPGITGWVVKVNDEGDILWQRCIGGFSNDYLFSVREASDGFIWAAGYTNSNDGDVNGNQGAGDAWVVKLDSSGTIIDNRCLGGAGGDRFKDVHVLPTGNTIAIGYTNSSDGDVTAPLGNTDVWAVCLSPDLEILWQRTLGGSLADLGEGIAPASDGGVVVAGLSLSADGNLTSNNGDADLWVVKLAPWDDTQVSEFDGASHLQVYPNPAKDLLTIDLGGYEQVGEEIEVFDAVGRTVIGPLKATSGVVHVSVAGLDTGSYSVVLRSAAGTRTRRFVKH
ncbi:MAG: T9SS type A sorting domain-containing protein [Flavobacteriales bacterium]|nr:T9SS type A sorting domain-containing protein [Flavobacteriales bacterium]